MKSLIENGVLITFDENDLTPEGHFECPEQVTRIDTKVFHNCTQLITVNLNRVIEIYNYSFAHCTSLISVSLPQAILIGHSAFRGCTSLININIPQIMHIESAAFFNCIKLRTLTLSSEITFDIKNGFFSSHDLQQLIVNDTIHPANVDNIRYALPNNGLPGILNPKNTIKLLSISKQINYLLLVQQVLKQHIVSDVHQTIFDYSNQLAFFKQVPATQVGSMQEHNLLMSKTIFLS